MSARAALPGFQVLGVQQLPALRQVIVELEGGEASS